jgi:acetyltransferase (GNAT) family protein
VTAVRESRALVRALLAADPIGGFVAEDDAGHVVGHAWVHPRGRVATIGPIAVEPAAQRRGAGRALLERCLAAVGPRATQVRLVQDAFDVGSLALYLSEGFRIVAPLLELELPVETVVPEPAALPGVVVRPATPGDLPRIVARDARAFGAERAHDVERRLTAGAAVVADRRGSVAGYALGGFGCLGSAAADDPNLVLAMIAALTGVAALRAAPLRVMIASTDRPQVDGLLDLGFRLFRACHYMIRGGGTAPPAGYVLMGGDLG